MDEYAPLETFILDHPDFNQQDEINELFRHRQRQQQLDKLLRGQITPCDYVDALAELGLDPDQFIATAIDNMAYVMANDLLAGCENSPLF